MRPSDSERDRLTTSDLAAQTPEREGKPVRESDPLADVESRQEAEQRAPRQEARHDGAREIGASAADPGVLMDPARLGEFRTRWTDVQARFVDDPRQTVEEADRLVAELFQVMAQTFAEGRSRLEEQWSRGELGTEDLRMLVHRYRAIFDTLLTH